MPLKRKKEREKERERKKKKKRREEKTKAACQMKRTSRGKEPEVISQLMDSLPVE